MDVCVSWLLILREKFIFWLGFEFEYPTMHSNALCTVFAVARMDNDTNMGIKHP